MKYGTIILDEEDIYGFLPNIIEMFEEGIKDNPDDKDIFTDAIAEARSLLDADDDRYLYKCWYNQMGAYIFEKMLPQTK